MDRGERRYRARAKKAEFHRKQKHAPWWTTTPASAGMYANHGKTCSCVMCGNPRRYMGTRTLAERRLEAAERDALKDVSRRRSTFRHVKPNLNACGYLRGG